jgi:hypothetical protein
VAANGITGEMRSRQTKRQLSRPISRSRLRSRGRACIACSIQPRNSERLMAKASSAPAMVLTAASAKPSGTL